jgi:hypothetical protein
MMKEEVWRQLPKTKLPGCYNRLVKFISRFNNPVGSAHANWEEAGTNHDGVQAPDIDIMGEVSQSERGWVLKEFRISIWEENWVVEASVESTEPSRGV